MIQQAEPTQVRIITSSWTIHPGWNAATIANDIAVIHLPTAVALNGKQRYRVFLLQHH